MIKQIEEHIAHRRPIGFAIAAILLRSAIVEADHRVFHSIGSFDALGNLWTGDNNCDAGDKARWVWVVEGGDSG